MAENGNNAAMREALATLRKRFDNNVVAYQDRYFKFSGWHWNKKAAEAARWRDVFYELREVCDAALSAPARNCDVYRTVDDAFSACHADRGYISDPVAERRSTISFMLSSAQETAKNEQCTPPIAKETANFEQPGNGDQAVDEDTSDGYHTFRELYRYRMLYNAAFFNMLSRHTSIPVVKSHRHGDGELCFGGGWFIVMAQLPTGQVSNHYEDRFWELFNLPEAEKAPEWDGHTPNDAADRLESFLEMREPDSDKSNPPGNNAAMREALENLLDEAEHGYEIRDAPVAGAPGERQTYHVVNAEYIIDTARAALSEPPRNCDRFTDELDAQLAFLNEEWLISVDRDSMLEKDKFDNWTDQMRSAYARWLMAKANEKGHNNDENDETVDIDSIMDDSDYLPGDVAIALGL